MMLFPSHMSPKAIVQNNGRPHKFSCDLCGTVGEGVYVQPAGKREAWAVLPEDWSEIEDCRTDARKQFVVCCGDSKCRHEAESHSG